MRSRYRICDVLWLKLVVALILKVLSGFGHSSARQQGTGNLFGTDRTNGRGLQPGEISWSKPAN